jgi:hypothetical protein
MAFAHSGRFTPAAAGALLAFVSAGCLASVSCDGNKAPRGEAAEQRRADGPAAFALTSSDLDGYARGIRREIEAVRSAQQRSATAATPQERGEAMQASYETTTIPQGAEAAGLPVERYREVRKTVHEVFQTLDFQGRIDGPLSMDLSRASEATKEKLAEDAFAGLPAESAATLRGRMGELVPLWIEYVTLTAVAG